MYIPNRYKLVNDLFAFPELFYIDKIFQIFFMGFMVTVTNLFGLYGFTWYWLVPVFLSWNSV